MDKTTYKLYSSRLFTWFGACERPVLAERPVWGSTWLGTLQTKTWPVAFDVVSERTGVIMRFEKAGMYNRRPGYPGAGMVTFYTCRSSAVTIAIYE